MKSTSIRNRCLFVALASVSLLLVCLAFASCEWDPFGPDLREIAGGYRLKREDQTNQFALAIPYQTGGMIIDEIGWHRPFIIARGSGSDSWQAINTDRAERILITDEKRKSDPSYKSIQVESAEQAWAQLSRHKRLW